MIKVISDTRIPIKIWATDLEEEAERQLRNLSTLPFIHSHVSAMADAHAGKGSTVGTVIATKGAIIPACVGVDIGCGMMAIKTPFTGNQLEDLHLLRHSIERAVPTAHNSNKDVSERMANAYKSLGDVSEYAKEKMRNGILEKSAKAIGTLGGGNHFIEICLDLNNDVWIMLHSGSRNIGKCLAEIHINKAKDIMKEYFISLPDSDLAYLAQGTKEFDAYLHDLMWGQNFAKANREEMMHRVIEQLYRHMYKGNVPYDWQYFLASDYMDDAFFKVHCHHNYTSIENHFGKNVYITRKGAVSAKQYEWGIIPGSMGAKSFIVQGLGNADSFHSCSHGAGRKMSRTKARATFTLDDLAKQTNGVECDKTTAVLDEIPSAYKDIDLVMRNQADLVKPIYTLRQVLCVKGG